VIPVSREQHVGGYESWWDVPIAEVSTMDAVQEARDAYERARVAERTLL
jgi:3D-(3,5/4)-trihydroxycyclohexane-1,2-dione acylhydrolase (decyclizing)